LGFAHFGQQTEGKKASARQLLSVLLGASRWLHAGVCCRRQVLQQLLVHWLQHMKAGQQ